jgi:hypothetical protein
LILAKSRLADQTLLHGKPYSPQRDSRMTAGRFIRLAETARPTVHLAADGKPITALEGDTLLVALLPLRIRRWHTGRLLPDGSMPGLLGRD